MTLAVFIDNTRDKKSARSLSNAENITSESYDSNSIIVGYEDDTILDLTKEIGPGVGVVSVEAQEDPEEAIQKVLKIPGMDE